MHFKTTRGRIIRNHVMITLTLFRSGETAFGHGSRLEPDGGRAAIRRSAQVKVFQSSLDGGEALPVG